MASSLITIDDQLDSLAEMRVLIRTCPDGELYREHATLCETRIEEWLWSGGLHAA